MPPKIDEQLSPILMSVTGLTFSRIGQTLGVSDSSKLMNPLESAMLIDEIRILQSTGRGLGLSLQLGRLPLTHGFVPVNVMNKNNNVVPDAFPVNSNADITIRFPKPLYVPKGGYVVPKFMSLGTGNSTALDFAFVGRSLGKNAAVPKIISAPWWASWTTKALAASDTDQSSAADLVNSSAWPLFLQELNFGTINDSGGFTETDIINIAFQLQDWNGFATVRDLTPIHLLFSEFSLETKTVMPPKGFFTANVATNANYATTNIPYVLGIKGYRNVPLSELAS